MSGWHADQGIAEAGTSLAEAAGAVVLLHGRGATAGSILGLTSVLGRHDLTYRAPQARGGTWYPDRFVAPFEHNEPALSSALAVVGGVLDDLEAEGVEPERTVLLGFSQGACLALESAVRRPRRYGAVIAWSGGLIGPPATEWPARGAFDGAPVFLGCSDVDPHVPLWRVEESAKVFQSQGAAVDRRIYPGFGHGVNDDEIGAAKVLLEGVAGQGARGDSTAPVG
ncbi:MAG: dienelactone hydrolase family protein [Acidobacteriota bacterium]